ncbi:MAG: MarC family protein [Gammaproteobacteria bacterium]|nr:MAG: MarC family protein [Gammaproteobacteria bacterium]
MGLVETTLLLLLVIDPFGNLPFVLSILHPLSARRYRRVVVREILLAFLVLSAFALAGQRLLHYLNVQQASLSVAGGIILFLIAIHMIFRSSVEIFHDHYAQDPILVPIAVPSIAGPSAVTVVILLRNRAQADPLEIVLVLALVLTVTAVILLAGRWLGRWLGRRGLLALEKFMGLLLSLVSVNMILTGIVGFLAGVRTG